ncbi:hypothetical protein Asp14428_40780 [Actinoplanes sp. NBRC 14428]|uniref:Secreted protein n=1 Tax=Pseudosporangium ferrugineum TaxID=439699 RepID=A0A2T0S891_9ACTN|nr:hypothetical protein [Pseudosporangium ferrugineum]PRY29642.1 hypothetical protein CLV70_106364 [Pseudosporangium ferrugineum]BCJ52603.1 hypothetical protein Asp14428_40780 [Actinoplanes sp. NBRC 14428]
MRPNKLTQALLAGAVALSAVLATGVSAAAAPAPAAPAAPRATAGTMTSTVTGTFTDALGGTGAVTGTFTPTRFVAQGQRLLATGTLHSVLTDSAGTAVGTTDTTATLPVQLPGAGAAGARAECPVLDLVLGPLDLDLLGLQVHLNRVVLDITAVSGPGNLLGNLLCAITNLLNGGLPLPLPLLSNLLNQILALLAL